MAHRVHPKIFRIKNLANWDSRWLEKKKLPQYLEEDFKIREFLKKKLGLQPARRPRGPDESLGGRLGGWRPAKGGLLIGIEKIEIERFPGKINIIISSARPGLIIGRGGEGVEELKRELERMFLKGKPAFAKAQAGKREIKIEIREVKNPWLSASLSAQWISQQIEKRVRYRRVLKQALDKIASQKGVEGCRVEVAGRLDGKEIARTEWLKKGKLPRQTLRADIDYAKDQAFCTYGVVGVKVWIYKGEQF